MIFYWELSDPHSYPTLHCLWPAWQASATLSLHPLPNLPILHVLNLLGCSSRTVINLFNSSSLPSDLLLRAFRSSLLPFSTLSWASLSRQSYSLTPFPTQSPNPQCFNLLCCSSRSVINLFNSSSLPSDLLLRAFRSSLLLHFTLSRLAWQDRATLSPHPLPKLPILHVLNLLCCSSKSVIKLFNSFSLPSDLLLRAFRSSFLPFSTLTWASLARQSYSLTPPPTQSPNPQCSQLTMLFFKVSYKTIQFLFPAQWYFNESFQVLIPTRLYTVSGRLGKTELLSHPNWPDPQILHVLNLLCWLCCSSKSVIKLFNSSSLPSDLLLRAFRSSLLPCSTLSLARLARQSYSLTPSPTQSPKLQCSQLTMLLLKVSYKTIQFLFPAQRSFTESFQILTQYGKAELLSNPPPYLIPESSMFSTYYVVPQD